VRRCARFFPNSDRIRFRFQHKKGAWRWLESTATLQSSQPDLGQFVINSRDITERIQAEEETRRNLVLLQAVTEGTPDIVFVKDRDGHFLMINSVGARFLGAEVEDIVGKDCSVFFEPDLARILRESEQEVFESGMTRTCEEALTYRGETRTFLSVRAPYRDGKGEVIGMIGILRDISEQKALQNQLIRSERLAAMGELVAGVAHELNNPLAAISGFAQLLLQHADPEVQADAEGIYQMTDRAARIVRSLLAFARQTDRRERRPESLRVIVEETQEMMRYRLRDSDVDLVLDLADPDVFPYINAGQIEQVLLNLFSNAEFALRQREKDRRITVMTRRVKRGGREWGLLSVSDNGTGIPYEVQGRIFDPFFTTKQQGEGTGLGLSICHGLIEEHGGTITVQSKPGEGAAFFILLPLMES
jgi:PAS domain S-box-containing protein